MATKGPSKPTLEYILALQSELETRYADDDEEIRQAREMREMKFGIDLPEEYRFVSVEVKDPTITDEGQRVAAMMSVNPETLQITTPGKTSEKATRNATLREHWTKAVLQAAGRRQPGPDTSTKIKDSVANDGAGWCKLLFLKEVWDYRYSLKQKDFEDEVETDEKGNEVRDKNDKPVILKAAEKFNQATDEAAQAAGPPLIWMHVDTAAVYPVYQGLGMGEVLEVQERPQSSTFRQYRLGWRDGEIVPEELAEPQPTNSSTSSTSTIQWLEHWDSQWCTYVISAKGTGSGKRSGQIVKQFRHRYKRPPYFSAMGYWMSHWHNRKVGWSVGKSKQWMVRFRSFLWTILAQLAARDTLTTLIRTVPEGSPPMLGKDGNPLPDEKIELGVIKSMPPGGDLRPVVWPPVAQSLIALADTIDRAINKLESPNIAGPAGEASSGYQESLQLSEQRLKHDPIMQSIERMLDEMTPFLWDIVKNVIKEKVWAQSPEEDAGWLSLGPDDLKSPVHVKWTINPERPSAKLIESRYWTERISAQTASIDQAVEEMGDNPDEVLIGRMKDKIRETQEYMGAMMRFVFEDAGMGDLIADQAQEMAQTGQLGNGLMPPGMLQSGGPPMGPGGAAGMPQPQDQAALGMAPNAAGAQGIPMQGSVPGAGPGVVLPQTGAEASVMEM